jgi:hypothetical protein
VQGTFNFTESWSLVAEKELRHNSRLQMLSNNYASSESIKELRNLKVTIYCHERRPSGSLF